MGSHLGWPGGCRELTLRLVVIFHSCISSLYLGQVCAQAYVITRTVCFVYGTVNSVTCAVLYPRNPLFFPAPS